MRITIFKTLYQREKNLFSGNCCVYLANHKIGDGQVDFDLVGSEREFFCLLFEMAGRDTLNWFIRDYTLLSESSQAPFLEKFQRGTFRTDEADF